METWLIVVATALGAGIVGFGASSLLRSTSERDRAAEPTHSDAPPLDLIARVERIELAMPEYRIAMEQLADRCDEVLDVSERKRRRAASAEARAQAPQPELPMTRADQIRLVRQRLG